MKPKKIPLRKCLVSNQQYPKKELLRIVKTPQGEVKVDKTGKLNGRGAYIKLDEENLAKLVKSKALQRALETAVDEKVYLELKEML